MADYSSTDTREERLRKTDEETMRIDDEEMLKPEEHLARLDRERASARNERLQKQKIKGQQDFLTELSQHSDCRQ